MSFDLEAIAQLKIAGTYGICIAATLFTYDCILTWEQEKKLIWDASWSYGKFIFLLIRYTGPPAFIGFAFVQFGSPTSDLSCKVLMYFCLGSTIVIIHCSGLVLALRTWAVWDRNRLCGAIVGIAWMCVTILGSVFLVYSGIGLVTDGNSQFPGIPLAGCNPIDTPSTSAAALKLYICLATYEGVVFLLTVVRGLKYLHEARPTSLMLILYRDAFLGSVCLLAMTSTNAILNSIQSPHFYLPYLIGTAFYFIVPCRIILNLREATRLVDEWDLATTRLHYRDMVDHVVLQDMQTGVREF